jgi:hypothetical protein
MIAALGFGFDDEGPALARDFRAEARPGDPAADDHDIIVQDFAIHGAGYEFESPAV